MNNFSVNPLILQNTNKASASTNPSIQQVATVSGNFAKSLRKASGQKDTDKLMPKTEVEAVMSPQAIYQSFMSGKTAKSVMSKKALRGYVFTDETLAIFIGNGGAILVKVDNAIFWDSDGERNFTAKDAYELSKKYDVNAITPQNLYDLFSELTHLGVLSGEQVVDIFLTTGASPIFRNSLDGTTATDLERYLAYMIKQLEKREQTEQNQISLQSYTKMMKIIEKMKSA